MTNTAGCSTNEDRRRIRQHDGFLPRNFAGANERENTVERKDQRVGRQELSSQVGPFGGRSPRSGWEPHVGGTNAAQENHFAVCIHQGVAFEAKCPVNRIAALNRPERECAAASQHLEVAPPVDLWLVHHEIGGPVGVIAGPTGIGEGGVGRENDSGKQRGQAQRFRETSRDMTFHAASMRLEFNRTKNHTV